MTLLAAILLMEEDEILLEGLRRRHRFWMREWLKRRDTEVQNTVDKLTVEMLEVKKNKWSGPSHCV